ncbi:hypothetical protein LNKW23_23840 [Paralimibaculum aggregatum]|uniref:Uncharacterized protein n=1 Tax=Paralimibaculum aggregatum TaxID=3036245 RepID=A0ABQ6LL71_9RHOB|nr:hypothetical protein [Limibaculum sp. NKW23]GMG83171.1 hypothetical protein LNKW23_23840 [Limibaculum sp. NKW23]
MAGRRGAGMIPVREPLARQPAPRRVRIVLGRGDCAAPKRTPGGFRRFVAARGRVETSAIAAGLASRTDAGIGVLTRRHSRMRRFAGNRGNGAMAASGSLAGAWHRSRTGLARQGLAGERYRGIAFGKLPLRPARARGYEWSGRPR